jgi:hypothetical protein
MLFNGLARSIDRLPARCEAQDCGKVEPVVQAMISLEAVRAGA